MMIQACVRFLLSETVLILSLTKIVFLCVLNANILHQQLSPPLSSFLWQEEDINKRKQVAFYLMLLVRCAALSQSEKHWCFREGDLFRSNKRELWLCPCFLEDGHKASHDFIACSFHGELFFYPPEITDGTCNHYSCAMSLFCGLCHAVCGRKLSLCSKWQRCDLEQAVTWTFWCDELMLQRHVMFGVTGCKKTTTHVQSMVVKKHLSLFFVPLLTGGRTGWMSSCLTPLVVSFLVLNPHVSCVKPQLTPRGMNLSLHAVLSVN